MIIERGPQRRSITSTISVSEKEEEENPDRGRLLRNRRSTNDRISRTSRFAVVTALSLVSATSSSSKTYSSIRSSILKITPETMKCKLYCRGISCRYCSWKAWTKEQMAIEGLYSNWITKSILAMARPTKDAIDKFKIIEQFKKNGIVAVFNLQCPDEHNFCGPPLLKSGFSYDPEVFMKNKIYYYNYAIPDFEFCSIDIVLDMIKVMNFSLGEGKIAIHCHAGLGRTGAIIACYLVLSSGMSAEEALSKVRMARPNSVQSAIQVEIVERTEDLMQNHARVLPNVIGESLSSYFIWQNAFLPNEEARRFPHIPKLIFEICHRLLCYVFEPSGVTFKPTADGEHHIHSCTFGKLSVEWKNVFSHRGRAQNRYLINNLAQIAGFPYEKDAELIEKFQRIRVTEMKSQLDSLDTPQLLKLLHAYMTFFKKPLAPRKSLISWLELYSLERKCDNTPKIAYKEWHCLIFFLCNILSYLTNENYDITTELITYWLMNDVQSDVKSAVHAHMRGLFARNLREQELQAKEMHSKALEDKVEKN